MADFASMGGQFLRLQALLRGVYRGVSSRRPEAFYPETYTVWENMIWHESKGKAQARSSDGAAGLGQLRYPAVVDASRWLGEPAPPQSVPLDSVDNAKYSLGYLGYLYSTLPMSDDPMERTRTLLAGYNAGPSAVRQKGAETILATYPETREYARRILSEPEVQYAIQGSAEGLIASEKVPVKPETPVESSSGRRVPIRNQATTTSPSTPAPDALQSPETPISADELFGKGWDRPSVSGPKQQVTPDPRTPQVVIEAPGFEITPYQQSILAELNRRQGAQQ